MEKERKSFQSSSQQAEFARRPARPAPTVAEAQLRVFQDSARPAHGHGAHTPRAT
jgi:hypothetical protein